MRENRPLWIVVVSALLASSALAQDCPHPIDLTGDDRVNGADLGALLHAWGPCTGYCVEDIDGNGHVDKLDLETLVSAWGYIPLPEPVAPYGFSMLPGPTMMGGYDVFDADADGDMDVVAFQARSGGDAYVMAHLNDGDGNFTAVQSSVSNSLNSVNRVTWIDANGDELPDLALSKDVQIHVSMNLGNGHFGSVIAPPNGPGMVLGSIDVDSDGRRELLLGFGSSATVATFGGTAFQYAPLIAAAVSISFGAVGDLDGDGDDDAVLAGGTSAPFGYQVLVNNRGTLEAQPQVVLPARPFGLALADFEGDGVLDLWISLTGSAGLTVSRGTGQGRFAESTTVGPGGYVNLTVGDLNGDGRPDVLSNAGLQPSQQLRTGYNTGTSIVLSPNNAFISSREIVPLQPRIVDLDGDCRGEALAGYLGGVAVLTERGNNLLRPVVLNGALQRVSLATDLDGDGQKDLILFDGTTLFQVAWGNGADFVNSAKIQLPHTQGGAVFTVAAVDVNGDGWLDVVGVGAASQNNLKIWLNLGNRQFAAPIVQTLPGGPSAVFPARVDDDRYGDVLAMSYPPKLLRGNADGTLELVGQGEPVTWRGVAISDLDGDGDDDFIVGTYEGANRVWINDGGSIAPAPGMTFGSNHETYRIAGLDFDLDGDMDVLECYKDGNADYGMAVATWRNDGLAGGFTLAATAHVNGRFMTQLEGHLVSAVADLDGDGRQEVACLGNQFVTVLEVSPTGDVRVRHTFPALGASGIAAGSFGADRHGDIAVSGLLDNAQVFESSLPVR